MRSGAVGNPHSSTDLTTVAVTTIGEAHDEAVRESSFKPHNGTNSQPHWKPNDRPQCEACCSPFGNANADGGADGSALARAIIDPLRDPLRDPYGGALADALVATVVGSILMAFCLNIVSDEHGLLLGLHQ